MKVIFQSNDIGSITVVKSILDASGIPAVMLDEYSLYPSTLLYSGGGRLAVADEQEKEAAIIIGDYLKTIKEPSSPSALKCPVCGSEEFSPTLLSIIFGSNKYKCPACRHKFKI